MPPPHPSVSITHIHTHLHTHTYPRTNWIYFCLDNYQGHYIRFYQQLNRNVSWLLGCYRCDLCSAAESETAAALLRPWSAPAPGWTGSRVSSGSIWVGTYFWGKTIRDLFSVLQNLLLQTVGKNRINYEAALGMLPCNLFLHAPYVMQTRLRIAALFSSLSLLSVTSVLTNFHSIHKISISHCHK